ncbi:MAG: DUF4276 family protein [Alphaproteobacteria bacterium]|nr:DUF4276 family protein [Alphaproteobacteria bacterium]
MSRINIFTEDAISQAVAIRLVSELGHIEGNVKSINRKGYGNLKSNIDQYIKLSYSSAVFLLTDLDRNICATSLFENWKFQPSDHKNFFFRIAVKEIEAWLLADSHSFSKFTGVKENAIPHFVETIIDPKENLINLIKKQGKKEIKDGILPISPRVKVGFLYNQILVQYVNEYWNPEAAATRSPSLKRARERLRALKLS